MKTKLIKKKKKELYMPSKYLRKAIARSEVEFAEGKTKSFTSVKVILESLNSSD